MNFQLISFQQLKTSLQAMKNYILGVLPTKVSDLINDSEFTDKDYVDSELAKKQDTLQFATPPAASDIGKALIPSAISNGEVTEWEFGEAGLIDDVQVNGTSIVNNGIANIPLADTNTLGAVKVGTGLMMDNDSLTINAANSSHIKGGTIARVPITPVRQHEATFYGLTKAAGVDMSSSSNAVGTYTAEAKTAIKSMLGVEDPAVDDVQINGASIISNGIADIPLATNSSYGVIKGNSPSGIAINSSGAPYVNGASLAEVKSGTHLYKPIMPFRQHEATFYGLAKAAGLDMSSSDNPVGTYTDAAKSAIQSMIGVPSADSVVDDVQINGTSIVSNGVANIPKADTKGTLGVASVSANNGISINADGVLYIYRAQDDHIKAGNVGYRPIVPQTQHAATFYGLAKAAGADMKDSANPVGTYTDEAKSAIKTMIGVPVNSYDLNLGEAIPASADLDTYTTPGIYSADRTVVSSLVNSPTTYTRFKLVVDSAADGAIFQHAILTDGNHFSRVGTLVNNTWTFTGWDKYIKRTDYATAGIAGVVKVGQGLEIESDGKLKTSNAGAGVIKDGTTNLQLLTPGRQHLSTFYGLAKAAGDTTQSSSDNTVGTYTDSAKSAIKEMLGFATPEDVSAVDFSDRIAKSTGAASLLIGDIGVNKASGAGSLVEGAPTSSFMIISGEAGATTYTYKNLLIQSHITDTIQNGGNPIINYQIGTSPDNFIFITSINTTNKTITVNRTISDEALTDFRVSVSVPNIASGIISHVEGCSNISSGNMSHTEGTFNRSTGHVNHTEGIFNNVTGAYSHIEGYSNNVSSNYSHAEGSTHTVNGENGHAEGSRNTVSEAMAHAEGYMTTASGIASHSEGYSTTASGSESHAEGNTTTASGISSHAQGIGTIANAKSQHVFGEYNIADTPLQSTERGTYIEIVGNGTRENNVTVESNARTLDWSGNEWLAGTLKIGGTSYANATEVATVTDVDNVDFTDRLTKASTDSLSLTGKLTVGTNPTNSMDVVTKSYMDNVVAETALGGVEVTVSGTTPTITASANTRYICGEVTTLSVTPPEFGTTEIIFESGTTPTVLTLPAAVIMPEWFTIKSGYIYQISITNNKYGAVMMWQS